MSKSESFWDHPIESLEQALSIKKQIAALQEKLGSLFGSHPPSLSGVQTKTKGKRTMSASARARIAAAQRARWAKKKGTAVPAKAVKNPKKKGKMSAQGRANIIAAQKARWAKAKKNIATAGQPKFKII